MEKLKVQEQIQQQVGYQSALKIPYEPPTKTLIPVKPDERMMGCGHGAAKVVCPFSCGKSS